MEKDIGKFYKHNNSQLSTPPIKTPVILFLAAQISLSIELTIASVHSVRDKKQTNSIFCSKHFIQNGLSIINNDDIQSCETQRKQNFSIPTTSTPNHHAQSIANTSVNF